MTTEADAREIAGKLTKAQREAVLGPQPRDNCISPWTKASCRAALQDKGVVKNAMFSEELTALGLAVRTILQEQGR